MVETVSEVLEAVRADTGCTEVTLMEGPELGGFLRVLIRATTIESCLSAEVELQRIQVDELARQVQATGELPWEDSVVAVYPLWYAVSMAEDGTALRRPDPDNQVVIQYPRRLDLLAMGNDRAEVLQRIGVSVISEETREDWIVDDGPLGAEASANHVSAESRSLAHSSTNTNTSVISYPAVSSLSSPRKRRL